MRFVCIIISLLSAEAFVVNRSNRSMSMELRLDNGGGVARVFGVVAAASVFSLSNPPALAMDSHMPITPFASSTVKIADAIKVLDMGLPSYGDIKESKASVANVKSLSTDATGMMARSKNSFGAAESSRVSEKKAAPQKQEYVPKKEVYVPKKEEATSLPKYDF